MTKLRSYKIIRWKLIKSKSLTYSLFRNIHIMCQQTKPLDIFLVDLSIFLLFLFSHQQNKMPLVQGVKATSMIQVLLILDPWWVKNRTTFLFCSSSNHTFEFHILLWQGETRLLTFLYIYFWLTSVHAWHISFCHTKVYHCSWCGKATW